MYDPIKDIIIITLYELGPELKAWDEKILLMKICFIYCLVKIGLNAYKKIVIADCKMIHLENMNI